MREDADAEIRRTQALAALNRPEEIEKAKLLFKLLPQGPRSGLNADMVDGLHADEIVAKAKPLYGGGGGGGMQKHGNEWHDPDFAPDPHGADKHDHTTWFAVLTPLGAVLPASGAPTQTKVTGTNFTYYVLDFDSSSPEAFYAQFKLPPNYSPGYDLKVIIQWKSMVTSGAVVWGASILGRADGETYDSALGSEQTVTTDAPGTSGQIAMSEITISSPDIAAQDILIIKIRRVADNASDTMEADARMIMAAVKL